ncbi:MAG: EI24 domain-containing protein [Myxococcota bacterium]
MAAGASVGMNGLIEGFFRGLRYPLEGFGFIREHRLWRLAAMPIAINVLLFVAALALIGVVVWPWLAWANQGLEQWADGFEMAVIVWFAAAVIWMAWLLGALVVLGASSIVVLLIGQAVASPFLDMLSERVENIVLGTPEQPFTVAIVVRSIVLSLADLFWGLLFLVAVHIPIFLLGLVPGIGTVPASAASFAFGALLLAVEFIGLSMTRRFVSYRQRWAAIWRNRWLSLGFGSSSMLLLFVPGLNLILLPLAAVGGTLAFCDLYRAERLDLAGSMRVSGGIDAA